MPNLLEMKQIYKVYPNGIIANNYVDFSLEKGEIHALVGENGAGKTTLMKILFGIEKRTSGTIMLNNKEVDFSNPQDAIKNGIGMVHQHFMQVPSLTVAENIILGSEPTKGGFILNREKALKDAKEISEKFNFKINPSDKLGNCSVGTRQKIEILKALFHDAQILVLDEPTAVLTPQETNELFSQLKFLKESGFTIIFISHKLNEVKQISDRVTILRNAQQVGTYETSDISKKDISNLMVGQNTEWKLTKREKNNGKTLLKVKNLSVLDDNKKFKVNHIDFSLKSGEILGVVGVEGNGQRELIDALTGLEPFSGGKIIVNGTEVENLSIRKIRDLGLAHIPEDRMTFGIASEATIRENLFSTHSNEEKFNTKYMIDKSKVDEWSSDLVKNYSIKAKSPDDTIDSLSGGNIQKVVVAREFSANPKIIVADQPTRGIDVGAAQFIHNKFIELRDEGAAILLVSADLNEIIAVSDSLIVMYNGEIVAYIEDINQTNENELGRYMLGVEQQDKSQIRRVIRD